MTTTLPTHHLSLPEGVEMPLTPDEIAAKSFPSVLRGYAKWEVDEFLKDVALDYQRALGLAEWAMQRSAGAPAQGDHLRRHGSSSDNEPVDPSAMGSAGLAPVADDGVSSTTSAQPQIDRLGEHIRYLAILVNTMSQRIDRLEARVAATSAAPSFYPAPSVSAAPHGGSMPPPNGRYSVEAGSSASADDASAAEPGYAPMVAAKDWWPTESPLSVLTRTPGTSAPRNSYGPRA